MELENNLLLFFTGKSRFSAEIIEKQVKAMKSDEGTVKYMHKMKDAAFEMKKLLLKGRLHELGELLDVIWKYKKIQVKMYQLILLTKSIRQQGNRAQ